MRDSFLFYFAPVIVFSISVADHYNTRNYIVTIKPVNDRTEEYLVQRGHERIIIESNRPLFRNKGIKKRKPDFKLKESFTSNIAELEKIYSAIWEYISSMEATKTLR